MSDKEIQALVEAVAERTASRVLEALQGTLRDGVLPARAKGSEWQKEERNEECTSSTKKKGDDGESLRYRRRAREIMKRLKAKEMQSD